MRSVIRAAAKLPSIRRVHAMSFTVSRAVTAVAFLVIALLALMAAPAPSLALTGCVPNCQDTDAANRHNSRDPTDPTKWGEGKNVIGRAVDNYLKSAQRYIDAKKFDQALDAATNALKVSTTDYEKLKSNQYLILTNVDMNNTAGATLAAEAAADLTSIPENEQADIYTNATILAHAAGHYDKAAKYARKMQALKLNDDRSQRIIDGALKDEAKIAKP
jgi:tetratricopeptide (TPR) repeat protein